MRGYSNIEYPPVSDYGYGDLFDGMADFFSLDDVLDTGIAALSGGAGILLSSAVMPRIPMIKDSANIMAWATTVLGLLGGFLLAKVHKGAGLGFAAGTAGLGLAHLVGGLADMNIGLEFKSLPASMANLLNPGLQNAVVQEEKLFGQPVVEEEQLLAGFANAVVEEEGELSPGSYLTAN